MLPRTDLESKIIKDGLEICALYKSHKWAKAVQKQTAEAQKQIDALLDRIVQSDSPTVIRAYEKKIVTFETGKILLEENQEKPTCSTRDFDVALEHTNHPSHSRP